MSVAKLTILSLIVFTSYTCVAQADTALQQVQQQAKKYAATIDKKISTYQHRITQKTEKTLTKLAKWENKIKQLVQKVSPTTTQQFFSADKPSFNSLLQQLKSGEQIILLQTARYNQYTDDLQNSVQYLIDQQKQLNTKAIQPLQKAKAQLTELDKQTQQQEAIEAFIKERKKALMEMAYQHIGKSKYLTKINKEAYYYAETIKNYKALFSDKQKIEQTTITLLNKIPAFTKFVQQHGMLARLFGAPSAGGGDPTQSLAGLQTRASVNALIQNQIAAGGPNAMAQVQQNLQAAQAQLTQLRNKIANGGAAADGDMPNFKPQETKTKTFKQRLQLGGNLQFGKPNAFVGSQVDVAVSTGYKLNDKSIVGLGLSYKLNYGSVDNFYVKHGGVGLRSFVDYKLKKQFYLSGGYEMNYNQSFNNFRDIAVRPNSLGLGSPWQAAGLIGLSKKINVKTKFVKGTTFQLLYDMLHNTHAVPTQPVVFRVGYNF
jgi:hypothetical protein